MHGRLLRFTFAVGFAVAAATASMHASAASLSQQEEAAVRRVVASQLQAFAEDDADRAFEAATPGVRKAIGNSGRFLAMVRGSYPMVYRPSTVTFLKPQEDDGVVLQMVQIADSDNKSWIALYTLERQPDFSWRISGCTVSENRWRST
jgi:hypothetical protein